MLIWSNTNWICSPPKILSELEFWLEKSDDFRTLLAFFKYSSRILLTYVPLTKFRPKKLMNSKLLAQCAHLSISFHCILSLLFLDFSGRNFFKEVDGCGILHNFLLEYWLVGFRFALYYWIFERGFSDFDHCASLAREHRGNRLLH